MKVYLRDNFLAIHLSNCGIVVSMFSETETELLFQIVSDKIPGNFRWDILKAKFEIAGYEVEFLPKNMIQIQKPKDDNQN